MGNSGTKFEDIFESVKRDKDVRSKYAGKMLPSFLKYTGAKSLKIIDAAKKREQILKNNNTPVGEIPGKIADFMKQELDRLITEDQYSEFGKWRKTNGVLLFGNPTPLAQADFGKRRRRRSVKKNSFGKKKNVRSSTRNIRRT